MKAQAQRLLDSVINRAYAQIDNALHRFARRGNCGIPFTYWDANHQQHDTVAWHDHFYHFQLGEFGGEPDTPLFFNQSIHRWDTVKNMPIQHLVFCADSLIYDANYNNN